MEKYALFSACKVKQVITYPIPFQSDMFFWAIELNVNGEIIEYEFRKMSNQCSNYISFSWCFSQVNYKKNLLQNNKVLSVFRAVINVVLIVVSLSDGFWDISSSSSIHSSQLFFVMSFKRFIPYVFAVNLHYRKIPNFFKLCMSLKAWE